MTVRIASPEAIVHPGGAGDERIEFEVSECPDFTLEVARRQPGNSPFDPAGQAWQHSPIAFAPARLAPAGRYVARVGVADLVPRESWSACDSDDANVYHGELQLWVTCRGDGRTAASDSLPVELAAANQAHRMPHEGRANLSALEEEGHAFAAADGWVAVWHPERQGPGAVAGEWISQRVVTAPETFVHRGTTGYIAAAQCPLPDCGTLPLPQDLGTAAANLVYVLALDAPTDAALIKGVLRVPGDVTLLSAEPDGSLLALSWVGGGARLSLVSRIRGSDVQVERVWRDERPEFTPPARVGEETYFITSLQGPGVSSIRMRSLHSDEMTLVGVPAGLHGEEPLFIELAPDAREWVAFQDADAYLGGPSMPWVTLPKSSRAAPGVLTTGRAHWSMQALLLQQMDGALYGIQRGDDHALLFREEGAQAWPTVLPRRDGTFLLLGRTGMRNIDAHGVPLASVDFPVCADSPRSAVELAGGTLAMQRGTMLQLFDASQRP